MKKLFLVHLGYYDELSDGVFESHTNIFVVADDFNTARIEAKSRKIVKDKKMHIDGLQLIEKVDGYVIGLNLSEHAETSVISHNFRELAPSKPTRAD